ncbi:MAG: hypothetical protein FWE18_05830 [Alphaproteobacteria bacterium]|nr:hypothetical protein [Alphaproteobacteria bacterium]
MNFVRKFILQIVALFFILPLAVSAYADDSDYAGANLKLFSGYVNSDVDFLDTTNFFVEVETFAKKGQWDIYGFTDFKFNDKKIDRLNYDFYKYIVRYDVINNSKLFLVLQAKETFNYTGDGFVGLGTQFDLPFMGVLKANAMYFLSSKDKDGKEVQIPAMIQFSWGKDFGQLGNTQFSLYHGGWSDIDLYEKRKDAPKTAAAFQIYEGVGLNYDSYGFELGYKYWMNVGGNKNTSANSVFGYLIKRF